MATKDKLINLEDLKVLSDHVEGEVTDLKSDLSEITTEVNSVNIFTGYTETGRFDNTTGDEVATTAYVRSDFIPLDASKSTLYILRTEAPWDMKLFFYTVDKEFISPNVQVFNANATTLTNSVAIPTGALYVRTYRTTSATGNVQFSYTSESEYTPHQEPGIFLKNGIVSAENLSSELRAEIAKANDVAQIENDLLTHETTNFFDGTFPNSGYIDSNGADATGSSWRRTEYVPITTGNSTLYILRTAQPYVLNGYFYDSDKTPIGGIVRLFNVSSTALTLSVSIPSGAQYFRMYTSASDYSGNLMLSYSEQDSFVAYGERFVLQDDIVTENNLDNNLKVKINRSLELTGKTIAFMGDSIIGNFYDSTGVCSQIAEKTGANVINCAFGGSRIAYEHSLYGDASPTATGYVDGATDAQKNQVDQYRYWNALCGASIADAIASGVWTLQENAVSNMASGLSYFSDRLTQIKNVDWSTVDFIMWEYGTNDFMTGVALEGSNLFAYDYAFRHTIETILTAYPNIRIITVTPIYRWYQSNGSYTEDSNTYTTNDYTGTAHKLTDFVATANSVSRQYQIPCIDDYYTMGANRFTRLSFFDTTDGTHPNAQGRERIAEHIASQLVALI